MTIEGQRFARGAVATPHYLATAVGLGVLADGGAHQRCVLGEAVNDRLGVAGIERARIADEQVVDAKPVFDRG